MNSENDIKDTMVSAKRFEPESGTEQPRSLDVDVIEETESAEAMNSDVPQPAGADETTEGQPT